MDIRKSRVDCTFQFMVDDRPETQTEGFDGILDLFEHQYDEKTHFWYGVAEISCTYEEFDSVMRKGRPTEFGINIRLPDGRVGSGRHLTSYFRSDRQSEYTRVALIGWTALTVPTF